MQRLRIDKPPEHAVKRTVGQPLAGSLRVGMEEAFGEDFGSVRVHTGEHASASADAINADAFTVGEHIVLNESGRGSERLMAHELAHVVQQRRGGPDLAGSPAMEKSAEAAAGQHRNVHVEGGSSAGVARQEKADVVTQPEVAYTTLDDITTVTVAKVQLVTYKLLPSVQVTVQWTSDQPGVINLGILRKPDQPVILNPQAVLELRALGYQLRVFQRLIRTSLEERPIVLGDSVEPIKPPQKKKPVSTPKVVKPKPVEKTAELPALPAPEKEEELPPLPALDKEELPVLPKPDVLQATVEVAPEAPPVKAPDAPLRTPEQLIDDHTNWYGNLHEEDLGEDLLRRAMRGELDLAQHVLDTLSTFDRDDVAVAFAEAATDEQLRKLASTPEGRRLLDRLFDELTSGQVGDDEQKQANRILAIKTRTLLTEEQFAKGVQYARSHFVLPYKKPGLTVLTPSPIYARRLPDGKIAVHTRSDIYGTDYYRDPDVRLPERIWDEVVLNETDVVGVKFYDEGGTISYFPALYLLQLENESTRVALEKAGEAFGIGLTLGFGGLAAGGTDAAGGETVVGGASALARAGSLARTGLVWADRIAITLDLTNSVIQEHRGWIIQTFDGGRAFVSGLDQITAYVRIYGLVRGAAGLVSLENSLRKSYSSWRAAAKAAKLTEDELKAVDQISRTTEELLNSVERLEGDSPIRGVVEGGGQTTPPRTGHLRVAGTDEVELAPLVINAEEDVEVEQELKAASGSKERFAPPQAIRRIVPQKQTPLPRGRGGTSVSSGETSTPPRQSSGGGGGGRGKKGAGDLAEKRELRKYVRERLAEEKAGMKSDPTEFLTIHGPVEVNGATVGGENNFTQVAKKLQDASDARVQAGKAALPLDAKRVEDLLKEGEVDFVKRHDDLRAQYELLQKLASGKSVPEFEALNLSAGTKEQIREEFVAIHARRIGSLKMDIAEVWFDQLRVEIADLTLTENNPVHAFKTLLYKRVMEEMLPGYGVRAQDIKPLQNPYLKYLFTLIGE